MHDPSTWITAAIAIGGALVGGLVTGLFTWLAIWREHVHDREVYVERRSYQAVTLILEKLTAFDRAVSLTMKKPTFNEDVIDAGNDFAESLALRSIALQDDELRRRLRRHSQLASIIFDRIGKGGARLDEANVVDLNALRSHYIAVARATAAHVNGQSTLPEYADFDLMSRSQLLDWSENAEVAEAAWAAKIAATPS
jgi:hypothetical protein